MRCVLLGVYCEHGSLKSVLAEQGLFSGGRLMELGLINKRTVNRIRSKSLLAESGWRKAREGLQSGRR